MPDAPSMRPFAWLIAILVVFSALALTALWWGRDDQQAVGFLSALATFLSIPVAAFVSLVIVLFRLKPTTLPQSAYDPTCGPIFVVGNGSRDVKVVVGPEGVMITVGEPVSAPAAVLPVGQSTG